LKRATTTTKTEVAKVRTEPKTFAQQTSNVSATLRHWCRWNDKLSALFEPRYAMHIRSHYLQLYFHYHTAFSVLNRIKNTCSYKLLLSNLILMITINFS